jgi:hypothetical protein
MHDRDIPTVMKSVFRLAPYKLWKHRWKEWAEQEKSNPFLTDYFNIQFRIERSFDVTYEYYLARHKVPQLDPLGYELFSFLALLVGVYQRLSPKSVPPKTSSDSPKPPIGVKVSTCPAVVVGIMDNTLPQRK